ncbi:hypothetical protein BGZ59_006145 [Podila verticillata]|nr:hypothetical protein BGZ59_006145 [Podila verticillata]
MEAVGSLSVQAIESQDSNLPDGVAFNSEDDADSDEADLRAKANVSQLSAETRILFLGVMQSRKSTLIETIKKYADPGYVVNEKNIGGKIFSHTKDTMITAIRTNLPSPSISSE